MTLLPTVRSQLYEAAQRQSAASGRVPRALARRRWSGRSRSMPLIAVLAGLVLAGAALAASGVFQSGSPVQPGAPVSPTAGAGVALPTRARLLGLRVSDPDGGPPWGLRIITTNRGAECVQVGRLALGSIGTLGQDGVFHDDGRFHPLSENFELALNCGETDQNGNAYVADELAALPASGPGGGTKTIGGCRISGEQAAPWVRQTCPPADLRDVYFGLLGPQARSITYLTSPGGPIQRETLGPDGAYLVVRRHFIPCHPGQYLCANNGQYETGGGALSVGAILSVTYANTKTCRLPSDQQYARQLAGLVRRRPHAPIAAPPSCPPVGFARPAAHRVTAQQVASPIQVRLIRARIYCAPTAPYALTMLACPDGAPRGYATIKLGPSARPQTLVDVIFRARVAITSSDSHYQILIRQPPGRSTPGCPHGGGEGGPTDTNLRAGQRVEISQLFPSNCPGTYAGTITYVTTTGPANSMPALGLGQGVLVGRFTFTIR